MGPDATLIELCVFTDAEDEQRIAVPYRDGGVWYAHVEGITQGTRYGLRATGPHQPENGLRFNPAKLLIDPYAKALTGPVSWDGLMNAYAVGPGDDMVQDDRDSAPVIPKAIVQGPAEGPDPHTNHPIHPWSDTVIYEAHVKGLTQQHPDIPEDIRGTYAALAHPVIVEHLQKLGVTALELLPIQTFIDDEFLVRQDKRNYWGTSPLRGKPQSLDMRTATPTLKSVMLFTRFTKLESKSSSTSFLITLVKEAKWAPP